MKFFIANVLFITFLPFYLLLLLFIFGSPKIYLVHAIIQKGEQYAIEKNIDYQIINKKNLNGELFYIEYPSENILKSISFLVSLFIIASLCINIILFYTKTHILLPIVSSKILSSILFFTIWYVPNLIKEEILFDIYKLTLNNLETKFILISPFLLTYIFVIIISFWYKVK